MTVELQNAPAPAVRAEQPAASDRMDARTKIVIGLLLFSTFVVILSETIMSVALPRLIVDLHITVSTAQWLTTGYLLTLAVVIPVTGYVIQRFTTRSVFLAAMSLFSLGTLIAAVAPGFEILMVGRVVQASGAALMIPLLITTIMNSVAPGRRGRMMAIVSIVIGVAPAIGPTASGIILNSLDWRWMFIIILPIALVALGLGLVFVRNLTTPVKGRFDVLSVVLSTLAFGGIIYGLSGIGESASGAVAVPVWIPLAVGGVALAAFVLRQLSLQRVDGALLDLRAFAIGRFSVSIVLVVLVMMTLFGSIIVLPLYLQEVLGLSAISTGLVLLPAGIVMAAVSPIVGRLFDRFGARPLIIPGSIIVSGALWGLSMVNAHSSILTIGILYAIMSIGLEVMITPLMTSALATLPPSLYSHGSAILSTVEQLAGAAGTALFVTLLSFGSADAAARGLGATASLASGIQIALFWGAVLSVAAIVVAFFLRREAR